MSGNYSSKDNDVYNSIVRSGSIYETLMEGAKLDLECEEKSSEVVTKKWTSSEMEEYLKKKGW